MPAPQEVTEGRPAPVVTLTFVGDRTGAEEATARLSGESRAALRQFSPERITGYGVDHADAVELRARVSEGPTPAIRSWSSRAAGTS
ncbi:hypothetical protein ACFWOG_31920 [Kitasatospora sp. NPDC058406]|uniref:hypothetical protein n=1 Tax=Kitasatospora sp. NPDC058406 TaxID=3346483 RepID=UPI00364D9475